MSEISIENKKRILFVGGELSPFVELSNFAVTLNELLVLSLEQNYEVRCILPKWGNINERRYKLHEVVRLSGLNIRIEKTDYNLEIKVASLPRVRLQIYFLGNEHIFPKRFDIYHNENNEWCADNGTRKAFFCKSTLELMRKFGWPPDIIFCSGWITSLIPFYIKTAFQHDALFQKTKIVTTLESQEFKEKLEKEFLQKALIDEKVDPAKLQIIKGLKFNDLRKAAIEYSDAVVITSKNVHKSLLEDLKNKQKEVVPLSANSDLMEYIKLFEILTQ